MNGPSELYVSPFSNYMLLDIKKPTFGFCIIPSIILSSLVVKILIITSLSELSTAISLHLSCCLAFKGQIPSGVSIHCSGNTPGMSLPFMYVLGLAGISQMHAYLYLVCMFLVALYFNDSVSYSR